MQLCQWCFFFWLLSLSLDGRLDWRVMQTLVRSMPDLHKTLILAHVYESESGALEVDEIAMATEHAPFRHRKEKKQVGGQAKRQKVE